MWGRLVRTAQNDESVPTEVDSITEGVEHDGFYEIDTSILLTVPLARCRRAFIR